MNDLKKQIQKINEGLFWSPNNTSISIKKDEIIRIRDYLIELYELKRGVAGEMVKKQQNKF